MPLITAGMKLTPDRLNNITPGYREIVTADQVSFANNTTYFNVTDLVHSVDSGKVYRFHIYLLYMASTVADFKMQLVGPAGATLGDWTFWGINTGGTYTFAAATNGIVTGLGGLGATTRQAFIGSGTLTIGGTAGTIQVQVAKNTAEATNLTIVKGSFMDVEELV